MDDEILFLGKHYRLVQNNNNLKVQNTIFALALFIFLFLTFDNNVKKTKYELGNGSNKTMNGFKSICETEWTMKFYSLASTKQFNGDDIFYVFYHLQSLN